MKPEDSKAYKVKDKPDKALKDAQKILPTLSAASKSTSRQDLTYDDGSGLVCTSFNGEPVEIELVVPPPDPSNPSEVAR